jgi:hypothetical protein
MPHHSAQIDLRQGLDLELIRLRANAIGERKEGWHGKSLGVELAIGNERFWLRVKARRTGVVPDRLWNGEREAVVFDGLVRKPKLIEVHDWVDNEIHWRSERMTFLARPVASATPELQVPVNTGDAWFEDLRSALTAIASVTTARVAVRQDLVTRRIQSVFGPEANTVVTKWITAHTDLNWANVTSGQLWLLDWESWGTAPECIDIAFLLAFSLSHEQTATRVRAFFTKELASPAGQLAQRFVCAELLAMSSAHDDSPILRPLLLKWAETLCEAR